MLLSLHGLSEDGFLAAVLVFHCARRRFQVLKGLGSSLGGMCDDSLGVTVDLQQRTAAGTGNFELGRGLSHARILPQLEETNHNRRLRAYQNSVPGIGLEDVTDRIAANPMV